MQLFQAWTNIKDETPPHPTTFFFFIFIPPPQLAASTIKLKTFNEHHTKSDVISNYRVHEIICVMYNSWHKSGKSSHGKNLLLVYDE
jgi:hypothetical protein